MNRLPPKARPEITVDIVVFTVEDRQLKVLLFRRTREPFVGRLALPGGFLWENETSAQAALRTLIDKTNVSGVFSEQLYTFDNPKRDKRGHIITVAYLALVPIETTNRSRLRDGAEFMNVDEVKALPFDHGQILKYAIKRLRTKLGYSNVAYSLLPKLFTLSQLQEVYEVILGHSVDKRNFRKKIMSLGLIEPTAQKQTGRKHRPAQLFRFQKHGYTELEEPIF